ncbi:Hypothetical protein FKW44_006443 [Caligus rogercresseyi]|uniref:Uncharacterized protein n=1 Tax=Caligus rogercresseyi TaxID=217165 RepID=A0A7T8QSW4_CALRO|nr:Hypothetical protein FKW44_006443 [Caligus rogercresseyi]
MHASSLLGEEETFLMCLGLLGLYGNETFFLQSNGASERSSPSRAPFLKDS